MEVDERLRWLESRISSSLRPRGEELRNFFADEENRAAFLAFCNHSESRRIFVHMTSSHDGGEGQIQVDTSPPKSISEKSLFFLKCSHASKLSRESISEDVVYSECSRVPIDHLELVMREVYLPLMSLQTTTQQRPSNDKLLDLMHRLVGAMQVTKGYSQGKVVLPMPSIEVLAEAAMNSDRRAAVVHVLESSVVSWMKQVKAALHLDCNSAIVKRHGKYAGPLAELEVWNKRLATLESVRDQMDSVVVLNILHSLEQAHSTYAQAFIHVHRDIGKAIVDTEHCLLYLKTLQQYFCKLDKVYSPDNLTKLFPPLMTTISLVWQYSGVYSSGPHFQRLLQLVSNEVMFKARDIVGEEVMDQPETSLINLKLALRVCAAFRGCYLDYRERSEVISVKHKERLESMKLQGDTTFDPSRGNQSVGTKPLQGGLCAWPPRNSTVFGSLSAFMERCNDLLELVQTVQDFRELEAAVYGVSEADGGCDGVGDPLISDIYTDFTTCLQQFTHGTKDLLNLEPESQFEEHFFRFRSTIKSLEKQIVGSLVCAFNSVPSLPAQLRVLEMFQGLSRRDDIKVSLMRQLESILSSMTSDVSLVSELLSTSQAPSLPHTPPVACKLLWLNALKERVSQPMEKVRETAPEILEGDSGWRFRQTYSAVVDTIDNLMTNTVSEWCESVPAGLQKSLRWNVLVRDSSDRLVVNLCPQLYSVFSEIRHLKRSPLNVRLPPALSQLVREVDWSELKHRQIGLQVVVQTYNEIQDALSEVERNLFQHKLQQTEQLLSVGLEQLDWTSVAFPDFIAKSRAVVCVDLQNTLNEVHRHMTAIEGCVQSWSKVAGLDVFSASKERTDLKQLETKNRQVLESLHTIIPPSVQRISKHIKETFQCIDEASQESPAWAAFLHKVDTTTLSGLKCMALSAISSLRQRANQYEQGHTIPPLLTVDLELQAADVQFSPTLSSHSALISVPEAVHKWIEEYLDLAKLVPRFGGTGESCYEGLCGDFELKGAVSKITAHLETNARQCQSLRKRFTIYSFLWEQDVSTTFNDFLCGQAPPHPRRFTRPETVRSRASARAHSGRPKSGSQSQATLPTSPESILAGVMGVSDWDFLRPPSMTSEEDESRRPSIDDFDGEIAVFQGVHDRLSNIEDVANVGWVCVDQRPVKQALSSLVSKWKHVYASHLERQVGHVLSALDQFFLEVEPEVECISGEESDTQAFMRLMNIFNKVNKQQAEMDTKFGAVHRAVLILDKFQCPIPPTIRNRFNSAPQRWVNLKKRVALGKQRVSPRIQAKGDIISQDLTRFREIFVNLKTEFLSSQCIHHGCLKEYAVGLISKFTTELKGLQTQAQDLIELQELLETSVFNFSLLKEFEDELATLQELWQLSESIEEVHSSWHHMWWSEVDSADLLSHTDQELDQLDDLPRTTVQGWDLFQYIHRRVAVVQANAPVLERLRSPSMRPRHWKQVLKHARTGTTHLLTRGGSFDVNLLEELTFGQFLEMELHDHASELHAIVDRANKDIAIESLLNTFEEVWLSKHLELRLHQRMADTGGQEALSELAMETSSTTPKSRAPSTRVTSEVRRTGHVSITLPTTPSHTSQGKVALICNTGGIFETLESHQTSLQSLEGTTAAAAFGDDLQKWHKQLQTIEAVLRVWLKVQLLWVQLEEVYGSSEVTQHLPNEAYTFSNVNTEWRDLMSSVARNTAVIAVCLKDGLLPSLEKLHSSLIQCQTALVRYVEGQRLKCPYFYFLPLEDILQLMCYSSSLDQLSAQIHKVLPHAAGLVFNDGLGSLSTNNTPSHAYSLPGGVSQSKITGVMSSTGERLDLLQGVQCDGPIDMIISKLMTSISSTLQSQLSTAITKYITPSPAHKQTEALLPPLVNLWKSNVYTQICLLATQIALDTALSKAIQSHAKLNDFISEIGSLLKAVFELQRGTGLSNESLTGLPEALMLAPSQSQVNLESNVALKASASNVCAVESSGLFSEVKSTSRHGISKHQLVRLQNIQLALVNYKLKANHLVALESTSVANSFEWSSMLHYEWSGRDQKAYISTQGAKLAYGYQYTGSAARIVVTPLLERSMHSLMQAVSNGGGALLNGKEGYGRSSLIHELAVTTGRLLFTVRCSAYTDVTAVLEAVKGMSATGSWVYLHSLDTLSPPTLQAVCSLLSKVQQVRLTRSTSIQWMKNTVAHCTDPIGACFATLSFSKKQPLPSSLLECFQSSSIGTPDRKVVLEALFLVSQFQTSQQLAYSLDRVCLAIIELYSNQTSTTVSSLSLYRLNAVVVLAQKHMKEFECLGLLSTEGDPPLNEALKMPSIVYSEVSQSTRASLKFKTGSEGSETQPFTQQLLEEFALVLALKDTLLPSLPLESKDHQIIVTLLSELFPSCDLKGLLDHEARVREEMVLKSIHELDAEESARESRAASVMQNVIEDTQTSEVGGTIEEQIVQSCQLLQLVPTAPFQSAVSQLVNMVQLSRFIVVSGPSCSGKTSVIQVAADTLSHCPSILTKSAPVTVTTLAVEALGEEQLLGHQDTSKGTWMDGLLSHCLTFQREGSWFVLEGALTASQLDSLLACESGPQSRLVLTNGRSLPIDPSVRFILEMTSLSSLTPSAVVQVSSLNLSSGTVSWCDALTQWFNTQSDTSLIKQHRDQLQALFNEYVPAIMEFTRPALYGTTNVSAGVSTSTLTSGVSLCRLQPQEVKLAEVHVMKTCCRVLQCLLLESHIDELSPASLERAVVYALIWSFGGFLTSSNKAVFDRWWRESFNRSTQHFPDDGVLWEYQLELDLSYFTLCSANPTPILSEDQPPFIPTVQSQSFHHLVGLLLKQGTPVLLNGASGSGKTALLLNYLREHCNTGCPDTSLLHLYVHQSTSAESVWAQVGDCLEWRWGRRYTPKAAKRLVCFIDDLHNTQCKSASEFLRQHISSGGYHDPATGKAHNISDVSYVVSAHLPSTQNVDGRLLKHFTVLHWNGYSSTQVSTIFISLLESVLPSDHPSDLVHGLVNTAIQVHRRVETMFLATPERLHYIFSMKDIAVIFRHLCSRIEAVSEAVDLLTEWQRASWWMYAGLMSSEVDRERYWEVVTHSLRKYFNQDTRLPQLLLESSARLPADVLEQNRQKLTHQLVEYNTSHPSLHVNLYDVTVEEVTQLCKILNSPHNMGQVLLLGYTQPEPLVQLASLYTGHTFTQPSHHFSSTLHTSSTPHGISPHSYTPKSLRKDLVHLYTVAGVKNEKTVLLLSKQELMDERFLTYVYQFVKGGAISPMFSKEEQSRIVTAIRSDLAQSGLPFTNEIAWNFFLKRVCANVRMVVSLHLLSDNLRSGSACWRELLSSLRVYTQLHWERKDLVDVALHHLKDCEFLPSRQSESLAHLLASVHLQLRKWQDTHSSNSAYEYFTERFVHQLKETHLVIESKASLVSSALECVSTAISQARTLEERKDKEKIILSEKDEACLKLLVQIGQDTAIMKQHSRLLAKQRERIMHLKKVIPEFEHACDLSLQEKADIVNSSQQVVLNMDQRGLCELRTILRPTEDIEELLVAVISVIKGPNADKTWTKGAKRLMANLDRFCELLMEFGACEENSEIVLEALEPLVHKPTFTAEHFSQYTAAAQLCTWIKGVHSLHSTLQTKIRPLQSKISTMQASFSEYSDRLKAQENKIRVLDERLAGLSVAMENASVEKSRQRDLVRAMQRECEQTTQFIQTLSDVHKTWSSVNTDVMATLSQCIGSTCLSVCQAVYLTTLPPHTQLEAINQQLLPVMRERGVELHWGEQDKYLSMFGAESSSEAPPQDSLELLTESQQVSQVHSYSQLSKHLVTSIAPRAFYDCWIGVCGNIPLLLAYSLIEHSWRKWPLVFDPHGLAGTWIRSSVGESLVTLDGSDRSGKFYQSLEQALVTGQSVLIEQFPCKPPDPSLQPLLSLKHSWKDGVNVVQLCGHRLHVHPSFKLYLTTPTSLPSLPATLSDQVTIVSSDISQPMADDLLLNVALEMLGGAEFKENINMSFGIVASCRAQLEELDKLFFEQLPCKGREPVYRLCTEKLAATVQRKNEVSSELEGHFSSLRDHFATKRHLQSAVQHAAMAYSIIGDIAVSTPHCSQDWASFVDVFKTSLAGLKNVNSDEEVCQAMQSFNECLLQNTIRCLDHDSWTSLACGLSLLSLSRPSLVNTLLLTEQLEYLNNSQSYLEEADLSVDIPDNPTCIPVDLWQAIHKLPLPVVYFSTVVNSTHNYPAFWEDLQNKPVTVDDFPWKGLVADPTLTGLEDQVLLRSINEGSSVQYLSSLVSSVLAGINVPTLSEVCEAGLKEKRPLLLLYDQKSQISQINHSNLETELKTVLKDKSLTVIKMGAGQEELVTEHLTKPSADCLLVEDLQYSPQHWLQQLPQHVRQATSTGCQLVFTVSVDSLNVSPELTQLCYTVLLSKVATISSKSIPKDLWLVKTMSHTQLLKVCLASIPKDLMSKMSKLPQRSRLLVYNLAVIHVTASRLTNTSCVPCTFNNLLRCLSALEGLNSDASVLDSIASSVRENYSGCLHVGELDALIAACLSTESAVPGAKIVLRYGEEHTVPSIGVDPAHYLDYVEKDQEHCISWTNFSAGIEVLLLPLLSRLPTQGPAVLPSTPLSPSRPTPSHVTRGLVATLDYCSENLPPSVDTCSAGAAEMRVCSELPSCEAYNHFRIDQLCSQFNQKLSSIRERDIPVLAHYSRVQFDSLPSSLVPTLQSLRQGLWPQEWRPEPAQGDQLSLADGIEELRNVRENLSSHIT